MLRVAELNDVNTLASLIRDSARTLAKGDYSEKQIEAALDGAWGVDTQLILDRNYYLVELNGKLVACGGWSRRRKLFGSDAMKEREPELLNPMKDAARIRAFFVHPDFARRGIGRMLLQRCEEEAKKAGFTTAELVATLPGERLYAACGYKEVERREYILRDGIGIEFVTMRRVIA